MTTDVVEQAPVKTLQDPEIKAALQELRQTDNWTNWLYLFATYTYFVAVIGGTVWFYSYQMESGISFWWNAPITMFAGKATACSWLLRVISPAQLLSMIRYG